MKKLKNIIMEICKEQKIKNTSVSENWITILEKEI